MAITVNHSGWLLYILKVMVKMISLVYVDLKFINWFTVEFYVTDQDFFTSSKKSGMTA